MGFEQFETPHRQYGVPTVSFTGIWVDFNAQAKAALDGVTHLQLLADPETLQVAFRPTDVRDPTGYKLNQARSRARVVSTHFALRAGITGKKFLLEQSGELFVVGTEVPVKRPATRDGSHFSL